MDKKGKYRNKPIRTAVPKKSIFTIDREKLAFEREKLLSEKMDKDLTEAHIYYRNSIAIVLRLFTHAGIVFAAIVGVYLTAYSYESKTPPVDTEAIRFVIALVGILASMYFIKFQGLTIRVYHTSRLSYLHPAREAAGHPRIPREVVPKDRKKLEKEVLRMFRNAHWVSFAVWVGVISLFHLYPLYTKYGNTIWLWLKSQIA